MNELHEKIIDGIRNGNDVWYLIKRVTEDELRSLLEYFIENPSILISDHYLEYLIQQGNTIDNWFHYACDQYNERIALFLLKKGANCDITEEDYEYRDISSFNKIVKNYCVDGENKILLKACLRERNMRALMSPDTYMCLDYNFAYTQNVIKGLDYIYKKYVKYTRQSITTGYLSRVPADIITYLLFF